MPLWEPITESTSYSELLHHIYCHFAKKKKNVKNAIFIISFAAKYTQRKYNYFLSITLLEDTRKGNVCNHKPTLLIYPLLYADCDYFWW